MVGLNKKELINLLDKYNPGETYDKDKLHEAIAKAIVDNNYRILDDVNAKLKNTPYNVFDFFK